MLTLKITEPHVGVNTILGITVEVLIGEETYVRRGNSPWGKGEDHEEHILWLTTEVVARIRRVSTPSTNLLA